MRVWTAIPKEHLGEFVDLFARLQDYYRDRLRRETPGREERGGELAEKRLQAVGISRLSSDPFWTALKTVARGTVLQEVERAVKKTPGKGPDLPAMTNPKIVPFAGPKREDPLQGFTIHKATPEWTAAYDKARGEGLSPEESYRAAYRAVPLKKLKVNP